MNFKDYEYKRPNYEEIKVKFDKLVEEFKDAETFELCNEKFLEIRKMRNTKQTMKSICDMRNNINTEDKFYSEEIKYWNESDPLFEELDNKFFEALINSNFRNKLEEEYSQQLFKIAELKLKGFSKDVIEEVQIENSLISQYKKLIGSAKINFQGKEMNLSELLKYKESKNRDVRKAASSAYSKFFEDNEEEFDNIYDGLVKVRDKMAKKLGYKNYVELGYIKRYRIDFNAEMVKVFRKQVKEYVVPLVSKLIEKQRERLNLETLEYYDEEVEFNSGNATPNGDTSWIIEKAMKMYAELSDNIKVFFEIMVKDELMDLDSKKGKSGGAYCNFIHDYNMPIMFLNFNGTCRDVDSLNHEVGHAFQSYCSRDVANMDEIIFPTFEAAEIHSTALEFITWPWMEKFFLKEADKYRFAHISYLLKFIPYGVAVDSFQHYVYENPIATPHERKSKWREIEKEYLPHRNYNQDKFLEKGGFWFRQKHIFESPFYYIDYALAQICAFQLWKKSKEDMEGCLNDYIRICKVGGTKSFLEIVELANLKSPFEDGCLKTVINEIEIWLDSVDDKGM